MAYLNVRRIGSIFDVNHILRGGIRLPLPYKGNERIYGLNGLTLTFTTPSNTVTFTDASNAGLTLKEIVNKIYTGSSSALTAEVKDGVLYIRQTSSAGPVVLTTSGTASGKFKLTATLTGVKYAAPGGTAPALVSLADSGSMDAFILVTEEA